jgi:2-oxoglutarate ferredoxin oxidoreductase subunit gamma
MLHDIVFCGFGGQGVLFGSQLLAYAAMEEGLHVTWFPSYGPEMRGGTANCTVIISDEEIGAPFVRHPGGVVAFNQPAVEKYAPLVAAGGILIYNASLVRQAPDRPGLRLAPVPASDIAAELGYARLLNMVMLGALLSVTAVLPVEAVERALEGHLPARRRDLLDLNKRALRRGMEAAPAQLRPAASPAAAAPPA